MLWRQDPRGGPRSTSQPEWPRNGAVLRGQVQVLDSPVQGNLNWLQCVEFQQAGSDKFVPTPGCWMQFDQGGLLLHEKK